MPGRGAVAVSVRRAALLGSVLAVCVVLLTLQSRAQGRTVGELVGLVTTPAQLALATVQRAALGTWQTYRDWKDVRGENARLRQENRRLRVEALVAAEALEENHRLRRLLALRDRLPLRTRPAEVIGREWGGWVRSLVVSPGGGDVIPRLTAVISPDGLVGRVVDVRLGAVVVQVLTDPASAVGAHAVRTRIPGVVEGGPQGTLRFKYMSRDAGRLAVGDWIVTSGQGGLFPRGIPIGRVRTVDERPTTLFHFATLEAAVDYARVDEVLLVTGERERDVTAAFDGARP
jgi:rod shape-determining protein MreC